MVGKDLSSAVGKWGFTGLAMVIVALLVAQVFGVSVKPAPKNNQLIQIQNDVRAIKTGLFGISSRLSLVEYRLQELEKRQREWIKKN